MKKITLLFTALLAFAVQGYSQFPAPYCGPITFSNNEEPITLVQFAGINNSSPAPVGQEAHQDFTAITGTVAQGISYPITLKGNTDGNFTTYLKVFIDWNQNNVFTDAGESYEIGTITNSTGTDAIVLNGTIAVPATAMLGSTRMRVVKKFSAYSDSCNTPGTGWGEAEDYTLMVEVATCTPPTVSFAVASLCPSPTFNVTVDLTAMGSAASYTVSDDQGSSSQTISAAGMLTFGPYASGTDVVITVADPDAALCNVVSTAFTDVCPPDCASNPMPVNAAVDVPVGPVTLTWDVPATGGTPTSYDLYAGDAADNLGFLGNYTTNSTGNTLNINAYGVEIFWQIVPLNAAGEAVGCEVWSFTTEDSPGYCLNAPNGQWPGETYTPETCDGITENVIVTNAYAGEYSVVNLTSGETYVFTSGDTDFVTLSEDGSTPLAYGPSPLTWVSTVSGPVRFYSHIDDQCGAETVDRVRSIVCGVATTDAPDYANLQWPPDATIPQGGSFDVYGQVYEPGVTEDPGQGAGIMAWVGINEDDTDPDTWTNWTPMTFNTAASSGNNDEYMATVGSTLDPGTYYYATRFRLNTGPYVYGGIDGTNGGGFWNGTQYVSGVLTVTPPPAPANDECVDATALTVDAAFCNGTNTNGTNLGATDSGMDLASCYNYGLNDVWFSFVGPTDTATVDISTDFTGGTLNDTEIALYSGACGSLTELDCSQDEGTTILENGFSWNSIIIDAPVTAGETYYVRVSGYSETDAGTFCIEVSKNQLSVPTNALSSLQVSPNPVKDVLHVNPDADVNSIKVFNLLGQQLLAKKVGANDTKDINMASLPRGTYMVELSSDSFTKTVKVLKD